MDSDFDVTFLSKSKFSKMVEDTSRDLNLSYMDSILHICDQNELEVEDVKKFISNVIKSKLEVEAMELNYLPRQNTLPFD